VVVSGGARLTRVQQREPSERRRPIGVATAGAEKVNR
jgi:hypothetical protein